MASAWSAKAVPGNSSNNEKKYISEFISRKVDGVIWVPQLTYVNDVEHMKKLDEYGKGAWIAFAVLGFILFWPLGLATLAFLLWSGRMGCGRNWGDEDPRARWERKMSRMQERMGSWGRGPDSGRRMGMGGFRPSGNRAFDEYREETIRKLEDEAGEFRDFLERLRHAKDKAEFDQFMADRHNRAEDTKDVTPRGN